QRHAGRGGRLVGEAEAVGGEEVGPLPAEDGQRLVASRMIGEEGGAEPGLGAPRLLDRGGSPGLEAASRVPAQERRDPEALPVPADRGGVAEGGEEVEGSVSREAEAGERLEGDAPLEDG